ncbi:hypothetical protein BX616_007417, partial [Lobosporangium transversale]
MSKEQTGRNGSDKNAVTVGSLTPVKVSVPNTNLHLAGHKNYLFQPTLANALAPYMDTFRFDFRGNGESDGQMGYSNWNDDLADIDAVISHFERQGYYIYALIGHSRGAISALNYAANFNHMPMIPYIISISSRFNMADVRRKHGPELMTLLENQGHFEWHARSAGKEITLRVTQQHFDDFVNLDTASVPVRDIADLHSHLSHARTTLRIINRADHNYKKHYKELSEMVAHYFSAEGRKQEWSRRVLPNWKTWVHAVEGVLNFRTVGDIWIPSKEDGTVSYLRPGIIYRSAEYVEHHRSVSKPTPEGIKTMEALNITDTFDLRSNSEIERRGT